MCVSQDTIICGMKIGFRRMCDTMQRKDNRFSVHVSQATVGVNWVGR